VNRVEAQFARDRASMIGQQARTGAVIGTLTSAATNAYRYTQYKTE